MITTYEPWDTLFFRDGKPFSMGEDTWATGIFPPLPSTIYGALRTAYLAEHPDVKDKIDTETEGLAVEGLFLRQGEHFLFPAPADCHKQKSQKNRVFLSYDLILNQDIALSGNHFRILKKLTPTQIPAREVFITDDHLRKYLSDVNPGEDRLEMPNACELDELIAYENKIGLGRDNATRSAQESMLYRVQMQRWKNLQLVVDANLETVGMDKPTQLRLGGEGKAVRLVEEEQRPVIPGPTHSGPCFKLYLATPALFRNGWLPGGFQKKEGYYTGIWRGVEVELLAAFVDKPVRIGGFDIKERRPKPMRQAAPAGSVYYLRALNADGNAINGAFHTKKISDFLPKQGFGLALVGALNHAFFKKLK